MRSSKQIGAETFVKNNVERNNGIRGWGINHVWRIGLSEHTKKETQTLKYTYITTIFGHFILYFQFS